MGYGNFLYRRPSGIYVFRLTVPESHRKWFTGAEIHQSTHLRDRGPAAAVAQQLRVAWSSIMSELLVMDLSAIDSASRLVSGDGEVALGDVANALHADVPTVALEMAHGGVKPITTQRAC